MSALRERVNQRKHARFLRKFHPPTDSMLKVLSDVQRFGDPVHSAKGRERGGRVRTIALLKTLGYLRETGEHPHRVWPPAPVDLTSAGAELLEDV